MSYDIHIIHTVLIYIHVYHTQIPIYIYMHTVPWAIKEMNASWNPKAKKKIKEQNVKFESFRTYEIEQRKVNSSVTICFPSFKNQKKVFYTFYGLNCIDFGSSFHILLGNHYIKVKKWRSGFMFVYTVHLTRRCCKLCAMLQYNSVHSTKLSVTLYTQLSFLCVLQWFAVLWSKK